VQYFDTLTWSVPDDVGNAEILKRLHPSSSQTGSFNSTTTLHDARSIAADQDGATSCSMSCPRKAGLCLLAMPHNPDQRIADDRIAKGRQ
jgi:hypothetical protein